MECTTRNVPFPHVCQCIIQDRPVTIFAGCLLDKLLIEMLSGQLSICRLVDCGHADVTDSLRHAKTSGVHGCATIFNIVKMKQFGFRKIQTA